MLCGDILRQDVSSLLRFFEAGTFEAKALCLYFYSLGSRRIPIDGFGVRHKAEVGSGVHVVFRRLALKFSGFNIDSSILQ